MPSPSPVVTFLREQLLLLLISFLAVSSTPAIVQAQGAGSEPAVFSEPLRLSRGELSPGSRDGYSLSREQFCEVMVVEWGWPDCEGAEAMVVLFNEQVDTLIVDRPNSDGHVRFDDWRSDDRDAAIADIEGQLAASAEEQGRRLGQSIRFEGWRVYPTLNESGHYLYYAHDVLWDGDLVTNVTAIVFDRRGYVEFSLTPVAVDASEAEVVGMIDDVLAQYQPFPEQRYAAFAAGDKIAAVGAVGVLATSLGVKYGGAAATGLLAVALVALKKGGVLLLLPFLWLGRLFRRRD